MCNSIVFERFRVDSRKRIKTVEWKRIYRSVFDDNENAYFWKRVTCGQGLIYSNAKIKKIKSKKDYRQLVGTLFRK